MRIWSKCFLVFLLITSSVMLTAQKAQENAVPLKNWATPLYWHPSQAEREAAAPQLQFSTNQVSADALTFVAITPCRLVDTRGAAAGFTGDTPFSGPSIAAGATATFPVQSTTEQATTAPAPCGVIPSIAEAYSLNITVIPHASGIVDYISIWPAGGTQPTVSTLNDLQGQIVANAAIVPAGTPSGGVSVYNSGPATADVIIDMNGFFAAPTDLNKNTAVGAGALASNAGFNNTATGTDALQDNSTGSQNTANGVGALMNNTTGLSNTASGFYALAFNTTGVANTASGISALQDNTTGGDNTATGGGALGSNTTGSYNMASGASALQDNTSGGGNTASGNGALESNTTGSYNTASGVGALIGNTTGSNNIAIGNDSAFSAPVGNSNSIYIGSQGSAADASGTIQIGTQSTQTGGTFVAGVSGANSSSGVEVYVNSNGQLGTMLSSGRFKEQITDMGDTSSKLLQLRPVNFFYKPEYDDGSHLLQYGLIAEEVAKVYPEMVAYGSDGQVLTVKYQLLAPMLLNELEKQAAQNRQQAEQNRQQNEKIRSLEDRLAAIEALLSAPQEPAR
jgi:hypothetical protein